MSGATGRYAGQACARLGKSPAGAWKIAAISQRILWNEGDPAIHKGAKGRHAWVSMAMRQLAIGKAFTLIEPGPVVPVTTNDGRKSNVMTISGTMMMDFTPRFAMTTGPWNFSWAALRKTRGRPFRVG